ncbi:MAG: aminotransferase class V-fold PLP-dependent enzyme [Bacteriovoracaceae bacterium]|jgi:cysteine desulfurase|nr:aminotransferase class V-fold PLP-dependent enzyme [Bacteriovoracaceae bacterium]
MIYADFNGSAPMHPSVREYLSKRVIDGPYANPNAIHSLGKKMGMGLEKARMSVAKNLGAKMNQIVFNSGSSEGITHVYHSVLNQTTKRTIITSGIEHSAVVQANKFYESKGFKIITVKTNPCGTICMDDFKSHFENNKSDIAMVSIMAANNETGVIQPHAEVGKLCSKNEVIFFSDTTQYIGKTDFDFCQSNMDFAVVSGHKIGAIIGSGVLLVKNPHSLIPLVFGGGQEFGKRGGTQNYIGAETLAVALEAFNEEKQRLNEINEMRLAFENKLKESFSNIVVIGDKANRLPTSTLMAYTGIHGQAVQIELESNDIFVTTSSACSDNEPETSKVLKAMGICDDIGRGVIRISFCTKVQQEHYDKIYNALFDIYSRLNKIKVS